MTSDCAFHGPPKSLGLMRSGQWRLDGAQTLIRKGGVQQWGSTDRMFKLRVPAGFPSNRCLVKHSRLAWGPQFSFSTPLNVCSTKWYIALEDVRTDFSSRRLCAKEPPGLRSAREVSNPRSCIKVQVDIEQRVHTCAQAANAKLTEE